jgi:hypothetical protein
VPGDFICGAGMTAAQSQLFDLPQLEAESVGHGARTFCTLCQNTGWRPVTVKGERAVTRCECTMPQRRRPQTAVRDHKAAAAGDR